MSLGIVIPSYKESENIAKLSLKILEVVPEAFVLVVDDTPDDSCVNAIGKLKNANIQILHRGSKSGRGSAVMAGLKLLVEKDYNYFLEMDADFSHPPEQIPELLQKAKKEKRDLIIASRYLEGSEIVNWPLSRRVFSYFSNKLARLVLGVPVADYTNGYRLYSKKAAKQILASCSSDLKGFIALSDILVNLYYRDYSIAEVPTRFVNRLRGESSLNSSEISHAFNGLISTYRKIPNIKSEKKRVETSSRA